MSEYVLRVKDLNVHYYTDAGVVKAANGVTFDLKPGERLGLVGESGSGKSTLALAMLRMIKPPGRIAGGQIWLEDTDLTKLSDEEMRQVRASRQLIYSADYTAMDGLVAYLTDNCCAASGAGCDTGCAPRVQKPARRGKAA